MAIPMLKIRRPLGRLIFNMGIAIPGKTVFLIETAPRLWPSFNDFESYRPPVRPAPGHTGPHPGPNGLPSEQYPGHNGLPLEQYPGRTGLSNEQRS